MAHHVNELIEKIKELEEEIEAEFQKKREDIHFVVEKKRVRFSEDVSREQRLVKARLFGYVAGARPLVVLVAPLIYCGFAPFLLLDLFLFLYQTACFPVFGIPRVKRSDYLVFDREDLRYLNIIERFSCFYCSYANGLASYFREIAARTEQYWCPIKHARRILAAHDRYPRFFEYGNAESYRKGLERLRKEFEKE